MATKDASRYQEPDPESYSAPPITTYEDFGNNSYRPYNRGNKLKRRAPENDFVGPKPSLLFFSNYEGDYELQKSMRKRAVIGRKSDMNDGDMVQSQDDPYSAVKFEELWTLPEKVADVPSHPTMAAALTSQRLKLLAGLSMEIIEREAILCKTLNRLADLLECDDPLTLDVSEAIVRETPAPVLSRTRKLLQAKIAASNDFVSVMTDIRSKVTEAYSSKRELARRLSLLEDDDDQGRPPPARKGKK